MISYTNFRQDVPTVELVQVVEFLDNKRKPITEKDRVAGPYPYYGANGVQDYVADWIFDEDLILLAEDGGHFENPDRGVAYKITGKTWVNNHAHVLRAKKVDVDYLKHVLKNMDLMPYVNGATRLKLTKSSAEKIKIPLPPIAQQKRIAAILDKAAEIKAKREEAIAKLDELAQSTFVEMFGDDTCAIKTLNELGAIKTGATPPSSKENMFGTQIPFVTPGDLCSGLQAKRLLTTEGAKESVTVRTGAALVCCIGATIGKMDIAKEVSAFNQQINAIEWNDEIDDVYGLYALKSIKGQVINNATSTTLPILKKSLFQQLKIKVPLKAKQLEFAARVKQASQCIAEQKQSLKKIDALCLSLQHQAFTTGFNA